MIRSFRSLLRAAFGDAASRAVHELPWIAGDYARLLVELPDLLRRWLEAAAEKVQPGDSTT